MSIYKTTGRFKTVKHATEVFNNRKSLMQMLSDVFHGKYRMSLLTSLIILFGISYIVLPFDFDWIPLIGWIDDGFVGYWVVKRLLSETKRYSRYKANERRLSRNEAFQDPVEIE